MENNTLREKELLDETAEKVSEILGNNRPIKKLRKNQILSAIIGAVGFALFIDGISKLFYLFPAWASLSLGFLLMITTGLLLHNLNR